MRECGPFIANGEQTLVSNAPTGLNSASTGPNHAPRRWKAERLFLLAALGALEACNAAAPPPVSVATLPPPPDRSVVRLPEGSACAGAVARYRAVIDNDLAMGHVNRSVYDQMQGEIASAATACEQGQDVRSMGMIRASKSRHGYPG